MRVARSISQFLESHVVPILTSTVIECHRAGLRRTAFEYASMLLRPEYRTQIADRYKRKIENVVRKYDKLMVGIEVYERCSIFGMLDCRSTLDCVCVCVCVCVCERERERERERKGNNHSQNGSNEQEDEETISTACPYCKAGVPEFELNCMSCKSVLPWCLATGKHMVVDDWAECPHCRHPCLTSELVNLMANHQACPMCGVMLSSTPSAQPIASQPEPENAS